MDLELPHQPAPVKFHRLQADAQAGGDPAAVGFCLTGRRGGDAMAVSDDISGPVALLLTLPARHPMTTRYPPGPRDWFFGLTIGLRSLREPLAFLQEMAREYGDIAHV